MGANGREGEGLVESIEKHENRFTDNEGGWMRLLRTEKAGGLGETSLASRGDGEGWWLGGEGTNDRGRPRTPECGRVGSLWGLQRREGKGQDGGVRGLWWPPDSNPKRIIIGIFNLKP